MNEYIKLEVYFEAKVKLALLYFIEEKNNTWQKNMKLE
jgi:hypothetical protein